MTPLGPYTLERTDNRAPREREGPVDDGAPVGVGLFDDEFSELWTPQEHAAALVDPAARTIEVFERHEHRAQLVGESGESKASATFDVLLELLELGIVFSSSLDFQPQDTSSCLQTARVWATLEN
jgi:hypothetical protein